MENFDVENEREYEGPGGLGLDAGDVFYALEALEGLEVPDEDKWGLMRALSNSFAYGFDSGELYDLISETFHLAGFGKEEISCFLENLQFPNSSQSSIDEITGLNHGVEKSL